jgi:hypothetical protein
MKLGRTDREPWEREPAGAERRTGKNSKGNRKGETGAESGPPWGSSRTRSRGTRERAGRRGMDEEGARGQEQGAGLGEIQGRGPSRGAGAPARRREKGDPPRRHGSTEGSRSAVKRESREMIKAWPPDIAPGCTRWRRNIRNRRWPEISAQGKKNQAPRRLEICFQELSGGVER